MSEVRRGIGQLLVIAIALVAAGGPVAAAPGRDEVYTALGVDRVAADYVVMVDISGSMNQGGRYDRVKQSLRSFLAALAPDDQVTLITFADRARVVRQSAPVGRSPDEVVGKLPKTADGRSTDIGAAIEASVGVLRRPGAPQIATVVLLTDGQHEPPTGSAYPFREGYSWNELARGAAGLRKSSVDAYAVPLAGATGAALLAKVYRGAKILDPGGIDRLTGLLERPKAAARAAKARQILGDDATRAVEVRWPSDVRDIGAGRHELAVELHSTTAKLPLRVDRLAVRSGNPQVRVSVPNSPVELPPGGTAKITVTVDWDAGPRRAAPLSTVTGQADLALTAHVGSPWAQVMSDDLGMTLQSGLAGAEATGELSAERGSIGLWVAGAVLLLALLAVLWRLRRRRLRPGLAGSLRVRSASGEEREIPLSGRTVVLNQGTAGLPGYGDVSAARLSVSASQIKLLISYSRDGSATGREHAECSPGETVTLGGVEFTWLGIPVQRSGVADRVPVLP